MNFEIVRNVKMYGMIHILGKELVQTALYLLILLQFMLKNLDKLAYHCTGILNININNDFDKWLSQTSS